MMEFMDSIILSARALKRAAFSLSGVALLALAGPVQAQTGAAAAPPAAAMPVPGDLELAKLIWSTIAAIDHANQSGNYSVLRDISSPAFQIANDPARLAQIFGSLRENRVDLSNSLLLAPVYNGPAQVGAGNVLRVRGSFGLRPTAIAFDFEFQWFNGKWRLFGVGISPLPLATQQPGAAPEVPDARRRGGQ
ncbi:hypothetical protein [Sphingopyxis sp. YF1]|jgi:hypothetical protein|uniref:hypothetical protein n=1 Tax=Sphingopyxis sp. YF1 TaxID=2482763 RepID=UPI001F62197F|nr:hypothetical protein [Sphingopyxis sp. YF1]